MDPHTRAQNLAELLSRLGLDVSAFADISGLAREQIDRWLKGNSKWRSAPALKQAAKALDMDQLQLERVLDGEIAVITAVAMAKDSVRKGLIASEQRRAVRKRVKDAAAKFEEDTGESPIEGLTEFAGALIWRVAGPSPSDAVTARAVAFLQQAMGDVMKRGEMELRPPSDAPPHERPSGTNRRSKRR